MYPYLTPRHFESTTESFRPVRVWRTEHENCPAMVVRGDSGSVRQLMCELDLCAADFEWTAADKSEARVWAPRGASTHDDIADELRRASDHSSVDLVFEVAQLPPQQ